MNVASGSGQDNGRNEVKSRPERSALVEIIKASPGVLAGLASFLVALTGLLTLLLK